ERLAHAIRAQIIEAEDQHTLELAAALERAWREEHGAARADAEASLAWRREVMRAARALRERAPDRGAEVRGRLGGYCARPRATGTGGGGRGRGGAGRPPPRSSCAGWSSTASSWPSRCRWRSGAWPRTRCPIRSRGSPSPPCVAPRRRRPPTRWRRASYSIRS